MTQTNPTRRFWHEPLVHFLIIGALVFGAHSVWKARTAEAARTIIVSSGQLQRLTAIWAGEAGREPTAQDVQGLLAEYVKEEALYREAQRLGLDRGDTIIRRRLAQKMTFLIEKDEGGEALTQDELREAFEADPSLYARPARVTFRHVPFNFDSGDEARAAEIEAALGDLKSSGEVDPATLGDPFMLSRVHAELTQVQVARLFGREFAGEMFALDAGDWQGPVRSRLATHLVLIETREEGGLPAFEDIVPEVRARETSARRERANDEALAKLLERYTVVLDDAPA